MISQIKYNLTNEEISYILHLLNLPDKFSYELANIHYSRNFIDFLVKNNEFTCILFFDNFDETNFEFEIYNAQSIILCHKTKLFLQNQSNKLHIELNDLFNLRRNINKKYDELDTLYIDFFYINKDFNTRYYLHSIINNLKVNFNNCIFNLKRYTTIFNQKFFAKNFYYYRPINLEKCKEINILDNEILSKSFIKVYNTFSYPLNYNLNKVICFNPQLNNIDFDNLFELIEFKLLTYNFSCSNIFNKITYDQIKNLFNDDTFYKFLIYDKNSNELTDFLCFIPNIYTKSNNDNNDNDNLIKCRNAQFYIGFFNSTNLQYKHDILEYICDYASKNDLFDTMTILDNIKSKDKVSTKFFKSIKKQFYFSTNLNLKHLNEENVYLNMQ
jgi:hypothetical protein